MEPCAFQSFAEAELRQCLRAPTADKLTADPVARERVGLMERSRHSGALEGVAERQPGESGSGDGDRLHARSAIMRYAPINVSSILQCHRVGASPSNSGSSLARNPASMLTDPSYSVM